MMKSYLRFEPKSRFGIITSSSCNVRYDSSGLLAITSGLTDVLVHNIRQASIISVIEGEDSNYPYSLASEISVIEISPDKSKLATGYSNGEIKIHNYINKATLVTLRGHRGSGVSSLAFDSQGILLASGGNDCDIIIWDLVSFTGICKLRGHKDSVTGLCFVQRNGFTQQNLLVSVSKDTLMKVWDIDTRYCLQTIVGHRCEIWSLAVVQTSITVDDGEVQVVTKIYTGSADEFIRGYIVSNNKSDNINVNDSEVILEYFGSIVRQTGGNDPCMSLTVNSNKNLLAAQSNGKTIEIYRFRLPTEVKKKIKRRLKRLQDKSNPLMIVDEENIKNEDENNDLNSFDKTMSDTALTDADSSAESFQGNSLKSATLFDELELLHTIRCMSKVRGFDFCPLINQDGHHVKSLVSLMNNTLEVYQIPLTKNNTDLDSNLNAPSKISIIDLNGHRSDVRSIALSGDGLTIASCSSESVKIWNAKSHLCIRTCKVEGYCISMEFAPGSRYVIVGTKEGVVQIIDTSSGEIVFSNEAHEGCAVWSIAVRPDGKGFMTGG
eukprot:gene9374-12630_t